MQLTFQRYVRWTDHLAAVCRECCCWSRVGMYDHITPVLRQLHGFQLGSGERVDFKIATLVYRSLSGMAPTYLATDCQLSSEEGRLQLRSAYSRTCVVRRTYSNFGDQLVLSKRTPAMNSLCSC